MKYHFIVSTLVLFTLACAPTTTIFIVRHAEKVDSSRDPDLTEAGLSRAARLAELLKKERIQQIYSTNYKRTTQTATPLSKLMNVPITLYAPDTLHTFAQSIKKLNSNALIVGHTNSTINLLNELGLSHTLKTIEDSDYSNLFKVSRKGKTAVLKLEELKY